MKYTPLYFVGRRLLPWFFRIVMPIRVRNADAMPQNGKIILCSNHASMTDPVRLAFAQSRQIFYMAKSELFQNRFVGAVIRGLGAFPVSRGTGDKQAVGNALALLNKENVLGIFIEGTRSKDGNLLRPKSGAVMLAHACGAPILPCCITAKDGRPPRLFHTCIISFARPIPPEDLCIEKGTPSEYRRASRMVMEQIAKLREQNLQEFGNKL